MLTSLAYDPAMRHLPPLAAVRVFEAAARHENFTAAAEELAMTQAAVSYQIKLLEERLGLALFRRERKRVILTEAGRSIAQRLTGAFDAIDQAFAQARAESDEMLTISTSETFAHAWFASRLGGFQLANPHMGVRLLAEDRLVDFARYDVDVAVRSGRGPWPGTVSERLIDINFTPMASPGFVAAQGGRLVPEDLLRLPQISPHDPWWPAWLGEAGVAPPDDGAVRPGIRLQSQSHEGAAAMAGQGVAMLTPFFWRTALAEGRLVRPFAQVSTQGYAYWLVYPDYRRTVPKIRRFRDWLVAEVRRDRQD